MVERINLVLLRTISNELELGMITSILEDNDIPFIVKNYGSGGYMRIISGASPFRTDIMVDEVAYEAANSLLEQISL
ncbi:MAG: DUF2007 domain-containing protein [Gudongella sp.]|nr:DUF2007 domain-containing protein [Gudongella sp.]